MSNRVMALNSFVSPVRTVASVLLLDQVVALMDKYFTDLPALFSCESLENGSVRLTVTHREAFLFGNATPPRPSGFYEYPQAVLQGCYAHPFVTIVWKTLISLQLIRMIDCFFFNRFFALPVK